MDFEWDELKARANQARHGVEFQEARAVFDDECALVESDDESTQERWRIIGKASGKGLFVVYTERHQDTIRIISARKANRHEQDRYYRQALPQG